MKRTLYIIIITASMLAVSASTIHNFDGNVYVDDEPLLGVNVTAWLNNESRGSSITQNFTTDYESYYNIDVQGELSEVGLNVTFTVNGVLVDESYEFDVLGNENDFDLHVEKAEQNIALVEGWNLISISVDPIL